MRALLIAALACSLASGCKDEKKTAMGGVTEHTAVGDDKTFHAPVRSAFAKAGLSVETFEETDAKRYAATRCATGRVAKLEVLVCEYAQADGAKAASKKLAGFVGGAVTGAVRQRGTLALVVADRDKVDLKGKSINKVLGTFMTAGGTPPAAPAKGT